jgi:hypothetical protein
MKVLKLAGVMGPSSLSIKTVSGPDVSGITAGASVGACVGAGVVAGGSVSGGEGGSVAAGVPHADNSRLSNTRLLKRKYNLCFILSPPIDLFNDTQDYSFCIYMFGAKIQTLYHRAYSAMKIVWGGWQEFCLV